MASRYGTGSTKGRRQIDDTPLSDAPIAKSLLSKAVPRAGYDGPPTPGWAMRANKVKFGNKATAYDEKAAKLKAARKIIKKDAEVAKVDLTKEKPAPAKGKKATKGQIAAGVGIVGAGTAVEGYALHREYKQQAKADEQLLEQIKNMHAKIKVPVFKSRIYDPEHKRQQRVGAATALLAVGSAAALHRGVKGTMKTTKLIRGLETKTQVRPDGTALTGNNSTAGARHRKVGEYGFARHAAMASNKDLAYLGGGVAAAGGAGAVQAHANSRRGKAWD